MFMKINTVADRIRSGLIRPEQITNVRKFAESEGMLCHSIPLKDGTALKILSNAIEYDCLIMKNGKVLTARGKAGTADDVALGICGLFDHIAKRRRAEEDVNVDFEYFNIIDDYLKSFEKFMSKI